MATKCISHIYNPSLRSEDPLTSDSGSEYIKVAIVHII